MTKTRFLQLSVSRQMKTQVYAAENSRQNGGSNDVLHLTFGLTVLEIPLVRGIPHRGELPPSPLTVINITSTTFFW